MGYKNAIDQLNTVRIGGINQYILERGDNKENPVVLFLHGGPGNAQIGYMPQYQKELEREFVVVNWDQRGAGLSYSEDIPKETMNLEQFLKDTVEVTNYLREKYNKDKIYLIGHSWGTILGMNVIYKHPELYNSYIGIGQVADMMKGETVVYNFVKEMALKNDNKEALQEIEQVDLPPYKKPLENIQTIRKWVNEYDGVMKNGELGPVMYKGMESSNYYNEEDIKNWEQGSGFNVMNLLDEMLTANPYEEIKEVKVPVAFFGGRHDYTTPSKTALEYLEHLKAPHKEFVWFENSAHMPMIEEWNKFSDEVLRVFKK
ncbi:alpha/beta fold hydrolase [Dethiothermospora halolimnae]|uniref:alpha/beta fold hydrolase n=1 Tax=Dethiothermospora halolimnae TaxID=3114390 RepID=UPI003CCBF167